MTVIINERVIDIQRNSRREKLVRKEEHIVKPFNFRK
jgi:hypothetical protein